MDYKTECGCIVVESPPNFRINYCPLHGSAPKLYEALKVLMDFISGLPLLDTYHHARRREVTRIYHKALAEAEGK